MTRPIKDALDSLLNLEMPNKQAQELSLMRPQRDVDCKECGETFKARDTRAMFCSNKCKQRDKYRRSKNG
jgi:hypothetical protein